MALKLHLPMRPSLSTIPWWARPLVDKLFLTTLAGRVPKTRNFHKNSWLAERKRREVSVLPATCFKTYDSIIIDGIIRKCQGRPAICIPTVVMCVSIDFLLRFITNGAAFYYQWVWQNALPMLAFECARNNNNRRGGTVWDSYRLWGGNKNIFSLSSSFLKESQQSQL